MKTVILPGSFDPVTSGHMEIITRAARLFDRVIIAVCTNSEKHYMFTDEKRYAAVCAAVADMPGVSVDNISDMLLAQYVRDKGADAIVKGARGAVDFEYELMLSRINEELSGGVPTVIIPASKESCFVSSTYVRELIKYGRPLGTAVPAESAKVLFGR